MSRTIDYSRLPDRFNLAKGNCYPTAYLLFMANPLVNTDRCYLCHGIARRTKPPYQYMGHAWVEEQDINGNWFCRDGLFPKRLWPRAFYCARGDVNPDSVRRYNRTTAKYSLQSFGHYGAWDVTISQAAHRQI